MGLWGTPPGRGGAGVAGLKLGHLDAGGAPDRAGGGSGLCGSGGHGCDLDGQRPSPSVCWRSGWSSWNWGPEGHVLWGWGTLSGRDQGLSLTLQVSPNKHTKSIRFLLPVLFRASSCPDRGLLGVSKHQVRGDALPVRGTDPYRTLTPGSAPPQKALSDTGCCGRPTSGINKHPKGSKAHTSPRGLSLAEGPHLHPALPTPSPLHPTLQSEIF